MIEDGLEESIKFTFDSGHSKVWKITDTLGITALIMGLALG